MVKFQFMTNNELNMFQFKRWW